MRSHEDPTKISLYIYIYTYCMNHQIYEFIWKWAPPIQMENNMNCHHPRFSTVKALYFGAPLLDQPMYWRWYESKRLISKTRWAYKRLFSPFSCCDSCACDRSCAKKTMISRKPWDLSKPSLHKTGAHGFIMFRLAKPDWNSKAWT